MVGGGDRVSQDLPGKGYLRERAVLWLPRPGKPLYGAAALPGPAALWR